MACLIKRWDQETRGLTEPSHESLLTPVDMTSGKEIRDKLDLIYR